MSAIGGLLAGATWQGWSVSSASSVLGTATDDADVLGASLLGARSADLVTLSDEAQAILGSQNDDNVDLSTVMDDMSASQVANLTMTVSSGEILTAMLDELDSLDLLSGLTP